MLYFAYGSNMSSALMQARCREAEALGIPTLPGFQFLITLNGYASLLPARGICVLGVVWRVTARDLAALNIYENIDSGLYRRRVAPVQMHRRRLPALVYIGRAVGPGRPRPGYLEVVIEAARERRLPSSYIAMIARWAPSAWRGVLAVETGEIGCPVSAT